jgi:hypothetical protein
MRRMLHSRPSAALVLSFIALFVALGGVGYSAARINGKVLKNRSVAGAKLKRNTVRGTEVKESTLGTVPSAQTAQSAQTALTADKADVAATALTVATASTIAPVRQVHAFSTLTNAANQYRTATANCAGGEKAISGGGGWVLTNSTTPTGIDAQVMGSRPEPPTESNDDTTGWRVYGRNNSPTPRRVLAVALCIPKA